MSSKKEGLAPGTLIMGPDGRTYTVDVDKRPNGGYLWSRGYRTTDWRTGKEKYTRHQLLGGPYLPIEGNEALREFNTQKNQALEPLQAQINDLHRRQAHVRAFVELTFLAVAEGKASYSLIQRAIAGEDDRQAATWEVFQQQVGSSISEDWKREYKVSLPYGVGMAVEVEGAEGKHDYVLVPLELSISTFPPTDVS